MTAKCFLRCGRPQRESSDLRVYSPVTHFKALNYSSSTTKGFPQKDVGWRDARGAVGAVVGRVALGALITPTSPPPDNAAITESQGRIKGDFSHVSHRQIWPEGSPKTSERKSPRSQWNYLGWGKKIWARMKLLEVLCHKNSSQWGHIQSPSNGCKSCFSLQQIDASPSGHEKHQPL